MDPLQIAPLEPPYPDAIQNDFDVVMPAGMEPLRLFRTLAHNPRVLHRFMSGGLLDRGSITLREREIVILRTTALCRSEYEWGVHVAFFAPKARLSEDQIVATVLGDANDPAWSAPEALLLELCDALHEGASLPDDLLRRVRDVWKEDQILELLVLAGFYHTVSFVTNGARVELEPAGRRFPEKASRVESPSRG